MADAGSSFFVRHEFLIRRLHSLTGLVFGAYVCVHLATNASILGGAEMFQNNVHTIHSLGPILVVVEWVFIFLPILFHAVVGLAITAGMIPNMHNYPYGANWRYTVQRISGLILFLFIGYHVFHMHGWFHFDWWIGIVEKWGGYQFRPYNAGSSAGIALQNMLVALIYAIGVVAAVFHFVNGIWSAGITWGVWTRPKAQARALTFCMSAGAILCVVGLSALWGMREIGRPENVEAARTAENRMYDAKVEAGLLPKNEHKRTGN
ncbi:MAG: succinate dehydrogenase cytochrome b558 subunit [Aeoliella sp.]